MGWFSRALGLIAVCCSTALADPPRAVIVGPTGGLPGDLIVLDASSSTGKFFRWAADPELAAPRPTFIEIEQGRKVLVASVPGTYKLFLAVANEEGVSLVKWTVTIGGNPTPPGPTPVPPGPQPTPVPPNPTPTPPAPLPDGRFGIAAKVAGWSSLVLSPTKATEAAALAAGLEGVASQIAAGGLAVDLKTITAAMLAANRNALGASMPLWLAFGGQYGAEIGKLAAAGRLATRDDWVAFLNESAAGFRAVK